jgi:hypothetical protein
MSRRRLRAVGALTAAFAVMAVGLAPASQADGARWANSLHLSPAGRGTLQHEIDMALRARPGGTQTSQYQVSWEGGQVVLSLPVPGTGRVPPGSGAGRVPPGSGSNRVLPGSGSDRVAPGFGGGRAVPLSSVVSTSDNCPWSFSARYTCFYSDVGFSGRRLQFADTYCSSAVNFGDWGFSNTISSWVNNSSHTVAAYDGPNTTGALLWKQYGVGHSANVGSAANDRADSASIC